MTMAERIQAVRKSKGLSQEELANIIGVSRQAVSKWESGQSVPDLDKVVTMSDCFGVTTDYLLKGLDHHRAAVDDGRKQTLSRILYISSVFFIAIGLLCAIGGWYEQQTAEVVGGGMIIQAVGLAGYFIGAVLSDVKAPLIVQWLDSILLLFMPVSMATAVLFRRIVAPYPTDILSWIPFTAVYSIAAAAAFVILWLLRRKRKR